MPKAAKAIDLEQIVTDTVQRSLRARLRTLLSEKLEKLNVCPPDDVLDRLVEQLFSGEIATVQWDNGEEAPRTGEIVITEEDISELDAIIAKARDNLPEAIEQASAECAKKLLRTLLRRWPEEGAWQLAERLGFQERLEERWGEPFGLLRMLITIAREIGGEYAKRLRRSRSMKSAYLHNVLLRLHMRACRVAAEIMALLENGFADGAMAR